MKNLSLFNWDGPHIDAHRRGISDIKWASMQRKGPPLYVKGDIVEFMVGGIGMVDTVSDARHGWPTSYSIEMVKGFPFHKNSKVAWHYEGDILRLVEGSASRRLKKIYP